MDGASPRHRDGSRRHRRHPRRAPGAPRLARRLLALLLPAGERRSVLADLHELFRHRRRRDGPFPARLWYWRQVVSFPFHRIIDSGRRRDGGRPRGVLVMREPLHGLARDLRFALRNLAAVPSFTLLALLALGLGIGTLAPTFSLIDAYFLRPLPFGEPGRLVHVWETRQEQGFDEARAAWPNVVDWRASAASFEDLAVFNYMSEDLTGGDRPEQVASGRVSANVLDVLQVEPALGRGFRAGEDRPGAEPVVILSDAFWRNRLGADPEVLGRTLELNGADHAVVGVMGPEFAFPLPVTRLWVPWILDETASPRDRHYLQVVGRLAPGVTAAAAQAELDGIAARLREAHPEANRGVGVNVTDLRAALNFAHEPLMFMSVVILLGGSFVLLIACANVSSLLLARGLSRGREIAIRGALGASRWQVVRQLLTESALLGLGGGLVGLALAAWLVRLAATTIPPDLYRVGEIALDLRAVAVTVAVALASALAFGLVPALRSVGAPVADVLRDGGRGATSSAGSLRLQRGLVVGQIALALMLLVGTGLTLRSLQALSSRDPGFDADRVLSMLVILPAERYDAAATRRFHRAVVDEIAALPGVESAATMNHLPLNHETNQVVVEIPGRPADAGDAPTAIQVTASEAAFATLGVELLEGRGFDSRDGADGAPVAVVTRTFAERYLGDGTAVGRTFRQRGDARPLRVVGVVDDLAFVDLSDAVRPLFFRPPTQVPNRYFRILARAAGDPGSLAGPTRQAVWRIDDDLPITYVRTLDAVVSQFLLGERSTSAVLAGLSGGALLLSCIGIYGVIAFLVSLRTREMSIRMTLGATPRDVLGQVLGSGLRLTLAGLGLGLAGAVVLGRLLASFLIGVDGLDPPTFVLVPLALGALSMLACWLPARRATRVDPIVAMRGE